MALGAIMCVLEDCGSHLAIAGWLHIIIAKIFSGSRHSSWSSVSFLKVWKVDRMFATRLTSG